MSYLRDIDIGEFNKGKSGRGDNLKAVVIRRCQHEYRSFRVRMTYTRQTMKAAARMNEYQLKMIVVVQWMRPLHTCKMRDFQKLMLYVPLHMTQSTNNPSQYTSAAPGAPVNFDV